MPLALFLLAFALRAWGIAGGGYVGDEGITYYLASVDPVRGLLDIHPPLYYGLLRGVGWALGGWPEGLLWAHALLASLAVPLLYPISPPGALAVALWPGLVEGGSYLRPHGLAPTVLALWVLVWERRRDLLPYAAQAMLLGHFATQVVLLLSLPFMGREERDRVLWGLALNPFLYLQGVKYLAVAYTFLLHGGGHLVPNWPEFLDGVLAEGLAALPLALLAGVGFMKHPLLALFAGGTLLAVGVLAGAYGAYAPPVALLFALGVGRALEGRGRFLLLLLALALLPLGVEAAQGVREARKEALALVSTTGGEESFVGFNQIINRCWR